MNFEAINASIAWHRASARRETSPALRRLKLVVDTPINVREMPSGLRAYTKRVPNRTALGDFKTDKAIAHEISLPFVSILGDEA